MGFLETWSDEEVDVEGRYTAHIGGPSPRYVDTVTPCPFCGCALQRMTNAASVGVNRVARIHGQAGGRWRFTADPMNAKTHQMLRCVACRVGFSTLKARE
jgi:hypothetical protein